jgi:hypothetical protein
MRRTSLASVQRAVTQSTAVAERSAEALAYNGRHMLRSHTGSQSGAHGHPDSLALRVNRGAERTRLLRHWPADALAAHLARALQCREVVDARVGCTSANAFERAVVRHGV